MYRLFERLQYIVDNGQVTRSELQVLAQAGKNASLKGLLHLKDAGAEVDVNNL